MVAGKLPAEFGQAAGRFVRRKAGRLLGRTDVKNLVDGVRATDPQVVDDMVTIGVTTAEVQRVLAGLLDDGVPIRDLVRILEAIGDRARTLRSVEAMIEAARHELGPAITSGLANDGRLTAVTMSAASENRLMQGLRIADGVSQLELLPDEADSLIRQLNDLAGVASARGITPVLVCSAPLRAALARLVRATVPTVAVVAYTEIGDHLQIDVIANVEIGPTTTTSQFGTSPEDFDAYAVQ